MLSAMVEMSVTAASMIKTLDRACQRAAFGRVTPDSRRLIRGAASAVVELVMLRPARYCRSRTLRASACQRVETWSTT
jgi:hypothetical protein